MNGMNLSGKAGHRARDADPAHVRAAADAVDPATERARCTSTTGPLQPSLTRQPRWSAGVRANSPCSANPARPQPCWTVRPNSHAGRPCSSTSIIGPAPARCSARCSSVSVMLSGCAGQPGTLTIGMSRRDAPPRTQVIAQPHRAGWVAPHRGDPAEGRAGAEGEHGGGTGREPVDPRAGGDRLARIRVEAERRPVPIAADLLVRDRALEHQDERVELACRGVEPRPHEVLAGLVGQQRVVDDERRRPGSILGSGPRRSGCVAAVIATDSPSQPSPLVSQSTFTGFRSPVSRSSVTRSVVEPSDECVSRPVDDAPARARSTASSWSLEAAVQMKIIGRAGDQIRLGPGA